MTKQRKGFALGGFKLRKWLTNSDKLREKKQSELHDNAKLNDKTKSANESYAKEILGRKEGMKNEKVLRLSWDCNEDCLFLNCPHLQKRPTD